jgi:hypothetical protein
MASGLRPYGIDRDKPCKLIDAQEITGGRLLSGFGGAINDRTGPGHAASPRACTIAALSTGR